MRIYVVKRYIHPTDRIANGVVHCDCCVVRTPHAQRTIDTPATGAEEGYINDLHHFRHFP